MTRFYLTFATIMVLALIGAIVGMGTASARGLIKPAKELIG
jgi:hypothetical protein